LEAKHSRETQELLTRLSVARKEATMHMRTCYSWGQHVLTRACRHAWQLKLFVLQCRHEMHSTQASLLQSKLELVDQLMQLLEIEYKHTATSTAPTNDFVIYSSFFKDPNEVMTNPEVERLARIMPQLVRTKRRAKLELHRLRITYQPEPLDRRVRRVKDIIARLHPSPHLPNYYLVVCVGESDRDRERFFLLSFGNN
jgi:hypothetical protein